MWRFLEYAKRRNQGFNPASAVSLSGESPWGDRIIGLLTLLCGIWLLADSAWVIGAAVVDFLDSVLIARGVPWKPY